jgi:hypothetical protein
LLLPVVGVVLLEAAALAVSELARGFLSQQVLITR